MNHNRRKRSITETSPELNSSSKKYSLSSNEIKMVGNLSIDELKNILNDIFSDKLKDLATREDLTTLYSEINSLKEENLQLNNQLNMMSERCELLENQLEFISRKANECSIVVHLPINQCNSISYTMLQAQLTFLLPSFEPKGLFAPIKLVYYPR